MIATLLTVVVVLGLVGCCVGLRRERADWGRVQLTERRRQLLADEAERNGLPFYERRRVRNGRVWR